MTTPAADRPDAPDDEAWLDEAFAAALAAASDGEPFALAPWLAQRPHLHDRLADTVATANDIAVQQPSRTPEVPGFQLGAELGRGAMGVVFRAVRTRDGMPLAVKVLAAAQFPSPQARARFRAEAATLRKLQHPHIVAVHDVVETPTLLAFAMDLVSGCSLARLVAAMRAAPAPAAPATLAAVLGIERLPAPDLTTFWLRRGTELAGALHVVHAAGLLHRDLKPSNVLVRSDGRAFLSDFGLAHDPDWSLHTKTGAMLGTPAYAAPEQLRGERDLDARTDVYGLGALLYEAFTAQRPFAAEQPAALLHAIESGRLLPPRRVEPTLPRELDAVLLCALAPERERRYPTAAAFGADLQRLLERQPVHARPPGVWLRTWRRLRRHRLTVVATATALALACALFLFGLWQFAERAAAPGRIAALVQQARLELLAADTGSDLWLAQRGAAPPQHLAVRHERLAAIAGAYAAARQLGELPAHAATEAEVLAVALALHRGGEVGAIRSPLLAAYAVAMSGSPGTPRQEHGHLTNQATAAADQRRALGLLAYLCSDLQTTVAAWDGLDFADEPDPLLDGALGLALLAQDQSARAWPRLLRAAEALPAAGCLTAAVADAALRCGDVRAAEHFLAKAQQLGNHDRAATLLRIEGDLAAHRGDPERAAACYQRAIAADNPLAQQRLLELLVGQGDWAAAVRALPPALDFGTERTRGRLLRGWWRHLPAWERTRTTLVVLRSRGGPADDLLPMLLARLGPPLPTGDQEEIEFEQQWGAILRLLRFVASDGRSLLSTLTNRTMTAPRLPLHTLSFPTPLAIALAALALGVAPATAQAPFWTQRTPAVSPPNLTDHGLVYDAARQETVLFGGFHYGTGADFNQTWVWNGTDWTRRFPATSPSTRAGVAFAYDSARSRVVLFGGYNHNLGGALADTWEWDGTNWTLRASGGPPARERASMTYDSVRSCMVLFGGSDSAQVPKNDTWEWDGTTWLQRNPAARPPARGSASLAFDPIRNRSVLFGGSLVADTWEWDGTNWTQRTPVQSPPQRGNIGMAWDAVRQRIVLFGGDSTAGRRNDTWSWDGTTWAPLCCAPVVPSPRRPFAMAYDSVRNLMVIACGDTATNGPGMLSDTWELSISPVAASTTFGTGCPGSLGTPTLQATTSPVVGATFTAELTNAAPGAAIFCIGWSNTQWNAFPLPLPLGAFGLAPSCTNYTSIDVTVWTFHAGVATYNLAIPCDPSFYGSVLYLQGASVDLALPSAVPIATSNGLQVTFGS